MNYEPQAVPEIYPSQEIALHVLDNQMRKKYELKILNHDYSGWKQEAEIGDTVKYHYPVEDREGNLQEKLLHVSLYRIANGWYEMTHLMD